ncbi:hypothetical protein Ais01nite_76520 [Asanoa ishikariensis]|uniref:ATP/GTP-binding protein n=1 Tax=Asanoa ishikariensis TaxID=137265 RepID=A0A1H3KXU6_9ACTN|nr:hypothetical protein [Asanoa ishikariensis]GIF69617.1 hypothetical protein Ais01nite_76520 [Asanoa ishikariensis]SDY57067.1 hypothetical protein SAMN05421684_0419 [Asanoa ishikariensis]
MLTAARRVAQFGVLAAGLAMVLNGTAFAADGGAECPPNQTTCDGWGEGGGQPGGGGTPPGGGGGNGGGAGPCIRDGEEVPCFDDLLGWFNRSDGCYYRVTEPQPAGVPEGMTSYTRSCGAGGLAGGEPVLLDNPPPGFGAPPDPAVLAQRALDSLNLLPPEIGIAPNPAVGPGLVGLPIWLWVPADPDPGDDESTWGPMTASESEGGVTVNLRAAVGKIVFDMGDGETLTCTNPGTPYARQGGKSPTCGYDGYRAASPRGGAYTVEATTTWTVTWVAGGQNGTIEGVTRDNEAQIQIDELQVVTK